MVSTPEVFTNDSPIRINPATMGYISAAIPPVKVNHAEEGTGNPEYILSWF